MHLIERWDFNHAIAGYRPPIHRGSFFIKFYSAHANNWKREPEGVHGQLEGFNRNLRPKDAVAHNNHLAPKCSDGQMYYTPLIILSKSGPIRYSSSRENAKKRIFFVMMKERFWLSLYLFQSRRLVLPTLWSFCTCAFLGVTKVISFSSGNFEKIVQESRVHISGIKHTYCSWF